MSEKQKGQQEDGFSPRTRQILLVLGIIAAVGVAIRYVYKSTQPPKAVPEPNISIAISKGLIPDPVSRSSSKFDSAMKNARQKARTPEFRACLQLTRFERLLSLQIFKPEWKTSSASAPEIPRDRWRDAISGAENADSLANGLRELADAIQPKYFTQQWQQRKSTWLAATQTRDFVQLLKALQELNSSLKPATFVPNRESRTQWETRVNELIQEFERMDPSEPSLKR